jgi:multiple sugar transport system substrate-binding protein
MTRSTTGSGVRIARRPLLKLGLGAAAASSFPAPFIARYARGSDFDWKRFAGTHLEVLLTLNPRADILQGNQAEFEELTGITVGSEQVPEQQQRQKQVIEFTSGNTTFDVTMSSWHVQKRLFAKGGWFEDLRPYLADPALTAPDYDFEDFSAGSIGYATQADGRLDTLPLNIDYWIVYWNKELFDEAGIAYPDTYEQMMEAARALTDPGRNRYGFVSRGLRNANTPVWTSLLLGWDVESIDSAGEMHTDSDEAILAAQMYKELNAEYAPPGTIGFNWNECQTSFSQGTVGMWFDGIGFAPPLENPQTSQVVGKVGYGVMPTGPRARHSGMFGTGIGISAYSPNKEAAYLYAQWATNKVNQARILQRGAGSPSRESAYRDEEALANLTVPMAFVDALIESGRIARAGLPEIIPVTEFRDVFGVALTNMIGGADPEAELRRATAEFRPVLERSERG